MRARTENPTGERRNRDACRAGSTPGTDPSGRAPHTRRMRGVPATGLTVGAPAAVPDLRPRRLLRLLAAEARQRARARHRASDRGVVRARGGLALVLRGRAVRMTANTGVPLRAGPDDH